MPENDLVMAIYPSSRGLGYVMCGDSPNDIIHYGVGTIKILSPTNYAKRLSKMIKRYRPKAVILKDYYDAGVVVSPRVRKVIETMEKEAYTNEIEVYRYSRKQIRKVFGQYTDNTNKYGISLILSTWYPELKRFLSPPRTFITPEGYYMPIYDAFALLYSHFTLSPLKPEQHHEHENNK